MAMTSLSSQFELAKNGDRRSLARLLTRIENGEEFKVDTQSLPWVLGVTGPPGSGKSSLIDRLASHWSNIGDRVAILAIDPSSPISGGALLGDRARMVHTNPSHVYFRSISTRGNHGGISPGLESMIVTLSGVGQSEFSVISVVNRVLLVDGPDRGDVLQAEKAGILEIADLIACNKSDLPGSSSSMRSIIDGLSFSENPPPVVSVSSLTGEGIQELAEKIDEVVPNQSKNIARAIITLESTMISRIRKSPVYEDVITKISERKITTLEGVELLEDQYGKL